MLDEIATLQPDERLWCSRRRIPNTPFLSDLAKLEKLSSTLNLNYHSGS